MQMPKLPKELRHIEHEGRSYTLYQCGCSHHKILEKGSKRSSVVAHLKWTYCLKHSEELKVAKDGLDKVWNNIIKGTVAVRKEELSSVKEEKKSK